MADLTNYSDKLTTYLITTDEQVAGSGKNFWDFFNPANSSVRFIVLGIYAVVKSDVVVTGTVSTKFDFYKTSAVGTGGTGALFESPLPNATTITRMDSTNLEIIPAYANAFFRSVPTGGATIKSYITRGYAMSEETNAGAILGQYFNLLPDSPHQNPLVLNSGEGLLCKQGAVAGNNSYSFQILFGIDLMGR